MPAELVTGYPFYRSATEWLRVTLRQAAQKEL